MSAVNGRVQARIENDEFMVGSLSWSPDGRKLAFSSVVFGFGNGYAVNQIETFDFRTRVRSKLLDVPAKYAAGNLLYSPDGRALLFDAFVDGDQIFVYEGTGVRTLVRGRSPAWLPGQQSLTFVRGRNVYALGQR
ncbi:MAG: hypothetical protein QN168_04695 [Armatimonadota bacterium]|nr:hypothetical protein [Armatimonadota bacterium]